MHALIPLRKLKEEREHAQHLQHPTMAFTAGGSGRRDNTRTEQMLSTVESASKRFSSFNSTSGGYLPPHLRNRRTKSSESKLTFATGDHRVPVAIERKEPRSTSAKLSERVLRSNPLPSTYVHVLTSTGLKKLRTRLRPRPTAQR